MTLTGALDQQHWNLTTAPVKMSRLSLKKYHYHYSGHSSQSILVLCFKKIYLSLVSFYPCLWQYSFKPNFFSRKVLA